MKKNRLFATIVVLTLLSLPACDSGSGEDIPGFGTFLVRYEVEGSCPGVASVGYTDDVGSTAGSGISLPWSVERTINTAGATSPVAVALAAACIGTPGTTSRLTVRLYVDGDLKDERTSSSSGSASLSVNVASLLQ